MAHPKQLLLLWITLQSLLLAVGAFAVPCPTNCMCYWVLDSLQADCSNSGLIDSPDFSDLQIQHLVLSHNHIEQFPVELADMPTLTNLDLSNNRIKYIDANALLGFTTLRTLNLANNSFTSWLDLNPNQLFTHAISLQRLVLSGNSLQTFSNDNPKELLISESLKYLELQHCGIQSVSGDVLMAGLPNLEYLELSGNSISAIATMPSKSLRVLSLSKCGLQRLNSFFLQGLPNLEALNLSWNAGIQLAASNYDDDGDGGDMLIASHTLNELDLSYCNLDNINVSGVPGLTVLHLRGNLLRAVSGQTFINNSLLESIDLSKNSLRVIESKTFAGLKRLATLDLSYNEIARLDMNVFRTNDVLAKLDLSHNIFEKFTKLVSNSLIEINLSYCRLNSLDADLLSGLSKIKLLNLTRNLITVFPSNMKSNTLEDLYLVGNRIGIIENNTLTGFPKLKTLALNDNKLTNPIPKEYFVSNPDLASISLGDNPWICDCSNEHLEEFFRFVTKKPAKLMDRKDFTCVAPPNHFGETILSACIEDWLSKRKESTSNTPFIVISFLAITLLVLFFYSEMSRKTRNTASAVEEQRAIVNAESEDKSWGKTAYIRKYGKLIENEI